MDKKITTFIFDCFGVICDPVLNGWYRDNLLNKGLVDENIKSVFEKFDLGKFTEDDIVDYFLKYDGVNSTRDQLREEIDNYLHLDTNLADLILKLKDQGFKTVLLSNANSAFFKRKVYIKYPRFKDLFTEIIISSDVGIIKPNKEIYLYTLKKVNSKPEEALFIDDSQINVDASLNVGMEGFLYTNYESFLSYIKNIGVNI